MEQLIIFLLFVVGSLISAYVQKKKAQAEERQQRELEELTSRGRGPQPPPRKAQSEWPQTAGDWQEQLRRMLQGETVAPPPPVIIKPVLLPPQKTAQQTASRKTPPQRMPQSSLPVHEKSEGDAEFQSRLKVSNANYERASKIQETVQARLRAASDQTTSHKPAVVILRPRRGHADFLRRLRRNPFALREAFVTSLVFGPPKSVEFETPTELKPEPRAI